MSSSSSNYCEDSNFVIIPIPDLIELFKLLFQGDQVDEVHNILVDREKKMSIELQNLEKEINMLKNECRLLDKMHTSAELEKSKLLDKLLTSQRECQELKEKIVGLNGRVKLADERFSDVCNEKSEMSNRHNKTVSELKNVILDRNEKVEEMRNEHQELKRQIMDANETIEKMRRDKLEHDRTEDRLRRHNLEASETIEELRRQNLKMLEAIEMLRRQISAAEMEKMTCNEMMNIEMRRKYDQTMEELRRENSNASQTIEELKRGKLEGEEVVERLGRKIAMGGEGLENILKLDERDLASIVKSNEKYSASKRRRM